MKTIKKFNLKVFLKLVFIGTSTLFSSCVSSFDDLLMYECDYLGIENFIPVSKYSRDAMNYMNAVNLGRDYPVHVLSSFNNNGCMVRGLSAKFGDSWIVIAETAINKACDYYIETDLGFYNKLRGKYYIGNTISRSAIQANLNELALFGFMGLTELSGSSVAPGDIVVTFQFSKWGGDDIRHCSYVTSVDNGFYTDSDGNIWSTEFAEIVLR